jgi:hypothetical protein
MFSYALSVSLSREKKTRNNNLILTFSIGSKCALMLQRKIINKHLTPAKGLILNKLLGSRSLVLVEEVWQFKGLTNAPLQSMCYDNGSIKHHRWGWAEVPSLLEDNDYLILTMPDEKLSQINSTVLESMIKKSVTDFREINDFI